MRIELIYGDIFSVACDAIVNPTDVNLSGSGGLDRKIQQMAGEGLKKSLNSGREKMKASGDVLVTEGYALGNRHIIHLVSPTYKGSMEALKKAYVNVLEAASQKRIKTIAIPAIGTGSGGFPVAGANCDDWISTAEVAVLETLNRIGQGSRGLACIQRVKLVFSNEKVFRAYQRAWWWLFGRGLNKRTRIRGALLGGALGDALGYPVEFQGLPEANIQDMILTDGKAIISDDTQMTLFTACGLLFGDTRGHMKGIGGDYYHYISMAYQDWYHTQGYPEDKMSVSWIRDIPELNVRRAPGNTCLSALEQGGGSVTKPINHSKGCGAVMRIAPLPLFYGIANYIGISEAQVSLARNCAEASAYTHGHPLGWLSSVALGNILYDVMQNFSLQFSVEDTIRFLRRHYGQYKEHVEKLVHLLKEAMRLSRMDITPEDMTKVLGEGWVGEEALAIGLCCAWSKGTARERLLKAVAHKGDSDSTGSIAGQIIGAYFGEEALPKEWLEKLELREVIEELAEDLYNGCPISEYSPYRDPAWEQKYLMRKPPERTSTDRYFISYVPESNCNQKIFQEVGAPWEKGHCKTEDGWVCYYENGEVTGYHKSYGFRMIPDRTKNQYLILGDFGKNPWQGYITKKHTEWDAPIRIEVKELPVKLLTQIVMDEKFQTDFL